MYALKYQNSLKFSFILKPLHGRAVRCGQFGRKTQLHIHLYKHTLNGKAIACCDSSFLPPNSNENLSVYQSQWRFPRLHQAEILLHPVNQHSNLLILINIKYANDIIVKILSQEIIIKLI